MSIRTKLTPAETTFVRAQRVGHLATADASGRPHVIPVCYAFDGTTFYIALDEKPKRVPPRELRRARNILERPEASLTIDLYDDDWSRLGYVLVHARATLVPPEERAHAPAVSLLRDRYPRYQAMDLERRSLIALSPDSVTSWSASSGAQLDTARAEPTGRGLDFLPLARGRHSVRKYDDRPVPRTLIETVLEAARWAPSPHGAQPWRFAVLTNPQPKRLLASAMAEAWKRNLEMDQQSEDVVTVRLDKSRNRILGAPVVIIPCLHLADLDRYPDAERQAAEEVMAVQSLGAAIQNLLLSAYTVGLDGGWMCAPLFCPDVVCAALGLDAALVPQALITLGYAASDPPRRERLSVGDLVVRWD